jgi:hypothetical protein
MATEFGLKVDLITLEDKLLLAFQKGVSDLQELLGNHRQDLNTDSVELVEASPASLLAQS